MAFLRFGAPARATAAEELGTPVFGVSLFELAQRFFHAADGPGEAGGGGWSLRFLSALRGWQDDTVIAPSGVLEDGQRNLILRPPADWPETGGTGNALDNVIRNESAVTAYIDGRGGDDTLIGGSGFDYFTFEGDFGHDRVDGGGGARNLIAFESDPVSVDFRAGTAASAGGSVTFTNVNVALGSPFDDVLIGDDRGVILMGRDGDDRLVGGRGDDELWGEGGWGHPEAGSGNDTLDGREGNDVLAGGPGADRFEFSTAPGPANADFILDFEPGIDTLVLHGEAHPGGLARVSYDGASGELWYQDPAAGALLIATLGGAPALAPGDLVLI